MTNREVLEAEITQLEEEATSLRRLNNETGYIMKMAEVNTKKAELDKLDQEEVIIATAEEITTSMETFTVGDITFTLEQLAVDEDAAEILRSALKSTGKAQAQKFLDEINNQKSVYDMQIALKQEQLNSVVADRDDLQNANAQLQLEKDDLTEKRDAAAQQLLEAQAEIARLNSHVDDLRKEIAVGSTNAPNVIDITSEAELEAAAQRLRAKQEQAAAEKRAAAEAAKIPVYDVKEVFRSQDGTYTTFKNAATGEPGEIIWTEFNSLYRKMDEAEVARFQSELEAEQANVPEVAEPVESDLVVEEPTIEAPTFREVSDAQPIDSMDEYSAERQDVPDGGSGIVAEETFEQAVERRLALLEAHAFGEIKAVA